MTINTQELRDLATDPNAYRSDLMVNLDLAACALDAQAAEIERLRKALRVAVLALAHAMQEHGAIYRPAYEAVDAALEAGPTPGPRRVSDDGLRVLDDTGGELMSRCPDGCSTLRTERGDQQRANVVLAAAANPEAIRALLAERDALREALRWSAAALQAACRTVYPSDEGDQIVMDNEFRTVGQILDGADAALTQQEQGK